MSEYQDNGGDIAAVAADREKIIIRTSLIGIGANVFLAAFKAGVGIAANSIAVILDAVNNLSDAMSSAITIIGAKFAGRRPDKKHPLGHGRAEYLSAMIVSAIVLYAGITAAVESVKKIIHPEPAEYTAVSLVIIGAAVVVKFFLGRYVKAQGVKANSGALEASGEDAFFDAILSLSVFASAVIFILTGLSLEAWVGVVIALFIIKSGIELMIETLDDIIGHRASAELVREIKAIINEEPQVRGAYDLFLNNYGPDKDFGSVHIELPDTMTVDEVDVLTRRLQVEVYKKTGVVMTGIGVYSYNTKDEDVCRMRDEIRELVLAHDWALQLHGFHMDAEAKSVRFDVVMSFDISAREGLMILYAELSSRFPDYTFVIAPDIDVTDI